MGFVASLGVSDAVAGSHFNLSSVVNMSAEVVMDTYEGIKPSSVLLMACP